MLGNLPSSWDSRFWELHQLHRPSHSFPCSQPPASRREGIDLAPLWRCGTRQTAPLTELELPMDAVQSLSHSLSDALSQVQHMSSTWHLDCYPTNAQVAKPWFMYSAYLRSQFLFHPTSRAFHVITTKTIVLTVQQSNNQQQRVFPGIRVIDDRLLKVWRSVDATLPWSLGQCPAFRSRMSDL